MCGRSTVASMSAFQAEDGGSIPLARSKNTSFFQKVYFCYYAWILAKISVWIAFFIKFFILLTKILFRVILLNT